MRGLLDLLWRNKFFFLLPFVICAVLIGVLMYMLGPTAIITFLYAGI